MKAFSIALALVLSATLLPRSAWPKCDLKLVELPVTMSGLRPLVTARINDADVTFVADSGAFFSMITPAAAEQLKLRLRPAPDWLRIEGITGRADVSVTRVDHLTLKKTAIPNVEFIVGGNELGAGAVGLLGQNLLALADVEYDFANGAIRIVSPGDDCKHASLAYWAGSKPVVEIELEFARGDRASRTASIAHVNGEKVRVLFDTGSGVSMLTLRAAKRAGLLPGGEGVVPAGVTHGIGRGEVQTWIAPVKNFSLGGEQINNTHLRFGDIDLDGVDMLIGADFFLAHRVYVANSQSKMYFTYNGGPAFDLSVSPQPPRPPTSSEDAAASPANELPAPADAAGYARRGAAFASRRDFDRALDDLTRACELEPGVGAYFAQRGKVRLSLGQQSLAMSDFNEALRLAPGDVDTRLARARLHLAGNDVASARADLDAADKIAARQANARFDMAHLYLGLDLPEAALVQFDQWIDAHDEDVNLPVALNGRCWARALLGIDLKKALKDCNSAVKSKPQSADYLDSRGLVYLRLGELDRALADYDAAVRIAPESAWSLYGRGLVHLRKGATEAGHSDIAAAKAIRPSIGDDAQRHGIAP
jgi:tetratricopeptide (TPR) repeat protein/predicted aspartyl protease